MAPLPPDEPERLGVLHALDVLDTAPEPAFDRIVALAKALSGADTAVVSLIDRDRQWFKARLGLDACETARDVAFCAHTILSDATLWVEDARLDPRFRGNPLVTGEPFIRFYAGAPIVVDGRRLGAVCVFDPRPQPHDAGFDARLRDLAAIASEEIVGRRLRYVASVSQRIAASTSDAILCADAQGTITYWNHAAETIFGHTAQEAIGQDLTLIVPERLRAGHAAGIQRVAAGGAGTLFGKTVDVPGLRKDGSEFPLELSLSTWGAGSGRGFAAIVRDCTERHRQQAVLADARRDADLAHRESQAAQQTRDQLVRHAPISLVMTDRDLRVLEVSGRWSEAYGRPPSDALGRSMHEIFPEGRETWEPIYQRCLTSGEAERGQRVSRRGDEPQRHFQWEVSPWRNGSGEIAGLLLMNVEVTDLVTAREKAQRWEQRLKLAIDIADLVVWEASFAEGKLHKTGDPDAIFGRPIDFEALTDQSFAIVHPDDRATVAEAWRRHQAGEGPFRVEHRANRPDGETLWVSSTLELVRGPGDKPKGVVGVLKDITAQKGLALEMARARDAAEAADRTKSQFLATMSHEIRTPLNGVVGVTSALRHTRLDPTQAQMVELIETSAGSLERMLMALLELAHIESGGVQLRHEPLDLRVFTQDLGALFGPQARKKGLDFEVAVEGEGESLVLGDALRLRQVMINLLDNALKFTREGSVKLRLHLRTAGSATRARFEVEDTGIGFDPADKERLFQSFQQADGSNTRRFDGSGVGLALCRSIANSMGGEVDASSSPGAGSTFSFTVDLTADADARQRAA